VPKFAQKQNISAVHTAYNRRITMTKILLEYNSYSGKFSLTNNNHFLVTAYEFNGKQWLDNKGAALEFNRCTKPTQKIIKGLTNELQKTNH
jgi:hypothetical protein